MRSSRLLATLLLLQTRGRMTAQALADEFEVSVRTIYRDIEHLSAADIPVYADRGPNGGFELLDGYRTRLTGLTASEAATLSLAGLPGPAAELGLADVLTMAQLKLAAALPEGARASANRVASRFHLDPVGWFRGAGDARWLPAIARAVWSETAVAVQYRRPDGVVSRKLRPLGLVLKGGIWYFVALSDEQTRTYRVSNLVEVAATEERFARPMGFDLVKFWTVTSQAFEASLYRATATVRVSPRGVEKLTLFGAAVAQAVVESAGAPDADEWVTVTIPIESIDQAATDLLRLGLDAEALEPVDLRRRIQSLVEDVRSLYACSAAPDTERVFGR
jgi:predicted DNA-binding transcriptional regulator YafY